MNKSKKAVIIVKNNEARCTTSSDLEKAAKELDIERIPGYTQHLPDRYEPTRYTTKHIICVSAGIVIDSRLGETIASFVKSEMQFKNPPYVTVTTEEAKDKVIEAYRSQDCLVTIINT
ncbi:hypothetical protein J4216_01385 [Candidatus Woesearchaeota archaeon]|nr:hypothetical protein [Candidatus Woesearchaeota archaeon]